ncbi:hypothetical protein DSO57_1003647 [Entomophthora muscae]|uniref:Uncharacterized protein n=1 Tax=Entomophthora muscae TaxID=34485 RepID=A0ACC2SLG6_9FUNG|nr:hypothetical protein DSO57_1003647 [Entomophthora muscae]
MLSWNLSPLAAQVDLPGLPFAAPIGCSGLAARLAKGGSRQAYQLVRTGLTIVGWVRLKISPQDKACIVEVFTLLEFESDATAMDFRG